MAANVIGLSPDYIIHPGVTLHDVLEDRGISQSELAHRTGVTEAHISKIVNEQKAISVVFAKKLEYALGLDAAFWINLQAQYDCELSQYEEANGVSENEIAVLKVLQEIVSYAQGLSFITRTNNKVSLVLDLRRLFCISNLCDIPALATSGAFRIKQIESVNNYVLIAWIRLCEILTSRNTLQSTFDKTKLEQSLGMIKEAMFLSAEEIQNELQRIFSSCGISFCIARSFRGAPIHGYIKKNSDGALMLAITIRQSFADIFWFTLFHEIGHILNGDIGTNSFIDYSANGEKEVNADKFACDFLIDPHKYQKFIEQEDFSISAVEKFAAQVHVPNYIVIGRLQKEQLLPYSTYSNYKLRYVWAE